jgi:[acyl-carrier-protein] S-malonyltransferase
MMTGFESLPAVRRTFEQAGNALGSDLWSLVSNGPDEELNKTVNTQPAMLTAGVALFRAWHELGGAAPALLAGHSLGEYSALVAAGVLELTDAVPLVRFRAQAMQEAVPEGRGAIAAILGLEDEAVRAVCLEASDVGVAEAANFNSPGQVVIAGEAKQSMSPPAEAWICFVASLLAMTARITAAGSPPRWSPGSPARNAPLPHPSARRRG